MGNVARISMALGNRERFHDLPTRKVGRTDVAQFANPDQVIKRCHNFLNRGCGIKRMKLQDIDMVGAKTG